MTEENVKVSLADIISQLQQNVSASASSPPFMPKAKETKEEAPKEPEVIVQNGQIIIERPPEHRISFPPKPANVVVGVGRTYNYEDSPDGPANIVLAKQKLRAWGGNVRAQGSSASSKQNDDANDDDSNIGLVDSTDVRQSASVDLKVVYGKQEEAISTLRRKLQEKKLGQTMVMENDEIIGENIVLRRSKFEVKPSQSMSAELEGKPHQRSSSGRTTTSIISNEPDVPKRTSMVNVQSKASASPLISISSLDRTRDEYINQFAGEKRPISESSPIKGDLEHILAAQSGVNQFAGEKRPISESSPIKGDLENILTAKSGVNQISGEKRPISESSPIKGELENILAARSGFKNAVPIPPPRSRTSSPNTTQTFAASEDQETSGAETTNGNSKYEDSIASGSTVSADESMPSAADESMPSADDDGNDMEDTIVKQKTKVEYKSMGNTSGNGPILFTMNEWSSRNTAATD